LNWVIENKKMGMNKIIDSLSQKYKIAPTVQKEINKYVAV